MPWRSRADGRGTDVRGAAAVFVLGTLLLMLVDAFVRDEPRPRGDEQIYELMARHPFGPHTFPFAYRVAVPLVVHVSPLSHTASFSLLAWLCSGGAAAFTYLIMRELGLRALPAGALAVALAVSPPLLVASLREGRNPDPSTALVLAAGVWLIMRRRYVWLAVVLLLGALVRESTLFLAPAAYAFWAERWWDPDALRRAVLVSAPMVAGYVALRIGIPTVGREQVPGYGGGAIGGRIDVIREGLGGPLKQLRRIFLAFGPLWLLLPAALAWSGWARRGLVLLAGALVSMTFALDWGRMAFLAAPLLYGAAAVVLVRRPRLAVPVVASWLAICAVYAVYMDRSGVQHGIIENALPRYPVR